MKAIGLFLSVLILSSCGGIHKVTSPMAHMPAKWRPYFQEMASITYKEYRRQYDEDTAIKLTNKKIGAIILNTPEKQLEKMEKYPYDKKARKPPVLTGG